MVYRSHWKRQSLEKVLRGDRPERSHHASQIQDKSPEDGKQKGTDLHSGKGDVQKDDGGME